MRTSRRNWVSPSEKLKLWDLWVRGQRILEISAGLKLAASAVSATLARAGGVRPRTKRRASALTEREREEISRGLAKELSLRCIAKKLGRPRRPFHGRSRGTTAAIGIARAALSDALAKL